MSDERQPEAVWVFPEKKSSKGRIWLIVALSVVALAIVAAVLYFFVFRNMAPAPEATPSPSATSTATVTPSPSASADPSPEPSVTPLPSPQPEPEPDLSTFTAEVKPRLDDAVRGLDLVADNMDVGAQIVDSLEQDASALSTQKAPGSLADDWTNAVAAYAEDLRDLRSALDDGSDPQASLDASRASLKALRALVGL